MKEKEQVINKTRRSFKAVVWFLLMVIVFSLTPNVAKERKTSGKFYGTKWCYNTKTKTLTLSCKGKMDDEPVNMDGENWPWGTWGYEMKRIEVKEGVTYIGSFATDYCFNVKSASLPDSLKEIGYAAFWNTKITRIKLPSNLNIIQGEAFAYSKLKEVVIPQKVVRIDGAAFKACKKLTKVKLPKKLEKISGWLFSYCPQLKTITLPSNVTQIGEGAFYQSGLTTIAIPGKVTRIKAEAFKKCTSLKKVTFKTNKLTTIEASLFEGCKKLTAITLPGSITKIKKQAFKGSGLTAIMIPGQVTAIEEEAFANCKGLKEVTFTGSQLTGIGTNAFRNVPADCVFKVPAGQAENIKALLTASGLADTITVTEY
ncbi:MAG: leucine-rich repeat domain-containing protein [Lachnospira sp.]|nr:leucine-rich repeat domain-containing protein [Lachnospira sp.]